MPSNEVPTVSTMRRTLAPTTYAEAFDFAQHLSKSSMVPAEYRGKPENILLAIQWGMEVGLAPLQAIQNIAVINGKPSVYGDALLAMVKGSPVCDDVIERFEGEGEQFAAVCEARRRGKVPVLARFSAADAKKAGLWGKTGPWTQYPRRMLQMRARGFALRDAFPDVLRGVITREEADDYPVDIGKARDPIDITPKADLDSFAAASGMETIDAETGEVVEIDLLVKAGDQATEGGKVKFTAWWNSAEIKPHRDLLRTHLKRWEVLATAADERGGPTPEDDNEDPFGLPPLDKQPTSPDRAERPGEDRANISASVQQPRRGEPLAGAVVQRIERPAPDREVAGSSPAGAANPDWLRRLHDLAAPVSDLANSRDWQPWLDAALALIAEASAADAAALRLAEWPAAQLLRRENGDLYAKLRDALTVRGKAAG